MLTPKSIGNKITSARKKMNLSQAELAHQVSISAQAVGKWERGESMPDLTTINRLAEIFGVDLNYFSDSFEVDEVKTAAFQSTQEKKQEEAISIKPIKKLNRNWNMSFGNWVDADFSGLQNLKEKFGASNIKNCKFLNADLSELVLNGNEISGSDFSGSDIRSSKIQSSELQKNNFTQCILIDAEFETSEVNGCNFTGSDLSGAEFKTVEFRNNNVVGVNWKLVTFNLSHLSNIGFDSDIEDCVFENCSFSKVTFLNMRLTNTFFKCKTLKHLSFTNCRADRITYEFLKNGKANLAGLTVVEE